MGKKSAIFGHFWQFWHIFGGKKPPGGQICVHVSQNVVYDTPQVETRPVVRYQQNPIKTSDN